MTTKQFILINKRDEQLVGLCSKPEENSSSCIMIVHGLALNMHEPGFDELTDRLVETGMTVFRMNMSDKNITLSNWADDIRQLYTYVKNQGFSNISVVAHSLGASATIAAQLPFKNLVLLAPTLNFYETMQLVFKDGFNPEGTSIRKWNDSLVTTLGPEFLPDTHCFDLVQMMKQSPSRLLYIHGSADTKVLLDSSIPLFNASTQQKQKYVGNFDHMLNPEQDKLNHLIVDWLLQNT